MWEMRTWLLLLSLMLASVTRAAEIRVLAAASLTDALEEIGLAWSASTGHRVVFNFGASNVLARQVEAGAPADLFLSADERTMDRLEAGGWIVSGSRADLLSNTLVVLTASTADATIRSAVELASSRIGTIALAEPQSVPVGIYAREYLDGLGQWNVLEKKVVPMDNARSVLAAVESGNVDAAIVYRTDALLARRSRIAFEVPRQSGPRISYPFALVQNAQHPGPAAMFLAYLQSDPAQQIFSNHRFLVPSTRLSGTARPIRGALPPVLALTLRTAALSTLLILVPGLTLAWLLARFRWRGKSLVETLVALPLVMPPVATGLILLTILGRRGALGGWLHSTFDIDVIFTWKAIVIAMMVMSFPLFVRAARVAIEEVDPRLEQIARTLGARDWRVFLTITLPLASRGVVSGILLAFARAVGEFGATILVAGNIPGKTSTLSLAIYNMVQLGRDDDALRLMAISVAIAFAAVWTSEAFLRKSPTRS